MMRTQDRNIVSQSGGVFAIHALADSLLRQLIQLVSTDLLRILKSSGCEHAMVVADVDRVGREHSTEVRGCVTPVVQPGRGSEHEKIEVIDLLRLEEGLTKAGYVAIHCGSMGFVVQYHFGNEVRVPEFLLYPMPSKFPELACIFGMIPLL